MTSVVEINDLEALQSYRLLWNALLPRTRGATFFHSLDWLQAYWRHFGQEQVLRVMIVYAGSEPAGILPLVVRRETTRIGPIRVLTYPLHDWGTIYGPIGSNLTATLLAGLGHVGRTAKDWDVLDLRWVDCEGIDGGRTALALQCKRLHATRSVWASSSQINLSGSWADYWSGRTSRWRNNVRRSEKKLAARGEISYVRYRPEGAARDDGDPRWDLYEHCEQIAARSWQGDSRTGTTLTHDGVRAFLRETHAAAAKVGALDLNLLLVGGAPVAFNYAYHCLGNVFGLRTGFDAALAAEGAGSVLQHRMIQDCFARGDRIYDLGPGYLSCKRYWQTNVVTSYRYAHYPWSSPRCQILRAKRWLSGRLPG